MNKRIAIFSLFFLAYGSMLAHNLVPHTHHEEAVEHHGDHHHDHEEQSEEGMLNLLLAEVVHVPGSADSYISHIVSSFFKFSTHEFLVLASELRTPSVASSPKHPPSFREERIPSFSVTNASLRAPPLA